MTFTAEGESVFLQDEPEAWRPRIPSPRAQTPQPTIPRRSSDERQTRTRPLYLRSLSLPFKMSTPSKQSDQASHHRRCRRLSLSYLWKISALLTLHPPPADETPHPHTHPALLPTHASIKQTYATNRSLTRLTCSTNVHPVFLVHRQCHRAMGPRRAGSISLAPGFISTSRSWRLSVSGVIQGAVGVWRSL